MIFPSSGSIVSAVSINISNEKIDQNVTIIKENIKYIYQDNKIVGTVPIMNESEQINWKKESDQAYINEINIEIGNNLELRQYYNQLNQNNIPYSDIYSKIMDKKSISSSKNIKLNNETIEKLRKEKELKRNIKNDETESTSGTYGFSPATRGANWKTIYSDNFAISSRLNLWNKITASPGSISHSNEAMKFSSTSGGGRAYAQSLILDMYKSADYSNMYYEYSIDFYLHSTNNHWVYLILNNHIDVVIDQGDNIAYYDTSTHNLYDGLSTSTWYRITAIYDLDGNTYDLYLYRVSDLSRLAYSLGNSPISIGAVDYMIIGDDENGGSNYADISVDNVLIKGTSKAKLFDTFEYGLSYDWRVQMYTTDYTGQILAKENGYLKIDSTNYDLANSAHIDYAGASDYRITLLFQLYDSDQSWMRLIDNGPIVLFLTSTELGYYSSGEYDITTLTSGYWYLLEAIKFTESGTCKFKVLINDPQRLTEASATKYICDGTSARDYLRIGNGVNDYGNIRVQFNKLTGIIGTDDDGDGMSTDFESNPKTQILGDDFETLWPGENHWYTGTGWVRRDPSTGPGQGAANSANCYALQGYSPYSDTNQILHTPTIYIGNINTSTDLKLVFDNWYDMDGDSGDTIKVNLVFGDTWGEINVGPVNIGDYSGLKSSGWIYLQTINIDESKWVNNNHHYMQIEFILDPDGDSTTDVGWFIDNIKLYSSTKYTSSPSTNSDSDGDGLTDGVEYYIWGSSPIRSDTDEDGLSDIEESTLDWLNDASINDEWGGRAIPGIIDVYIEVDNMPNHELLSSARQNIISKFSTNDIRIHFETDEPPNGNRGLTDTQYTNEDDCRAWQATDSQFEQDNLHELHYLCIVRENSDNQNILGLSEYGDMFMQFDTTCDSCSNDDAVQQGKTIMHEMGHQFGLDDYDPAQYWSQGATDVMLRGCWGGPGYSVHDYTYIDSHWLALDFGSNGQISNSEHQ